MVETGPQTENCNFHFRQIVEDIFALKRPYLHFRAFVSFSVIINPSYFVAEVKCILSDLKEQTNQ